MRRHRVSPPNSTLHIPGVLRILHSTFPVRYISPKRKKKVKARETWVHWEFVRIVSSLRLSVRAYSFVS
jgi:hypothetical protein